MAYTTLTVITIVGQALIGMMESVEIFPNSNVGQVYCRGKGFEITCQRVIKNI